LGQAKKNKSSAESLRLRKISRGEIMPVERKKLKKKQKKKRKLTRFGIDRGLPTLLREYETEETKSKC